MNIPFLIIVIVLFLLLVYYPKLLITTFILVFIYLLIKYLLDVKYVDKYINGNYTVISKLKMGSIIKVDGQRVLVKSTEDINPGDVISLSGHIIKIKNINNFDIVTYLKTKQIMSQIYPKTLSIITFNKSFFNLAHLYVKTGPQIWRSVAPLLLLGEHTKDTKELFELTKELSVVHLFVISGFHIGIIYKIILWVFKKLHIYYFELFSLLPLILYVFLLNWTIPAIRALLFISVMTFKGKISKISHRTNLDVLGVVGILLMIWNPYIDSSISFHLTFLASITIIYLNSIHFKNGFIKYFSINVGVFLVTLPIIISINGWVSIWGIFYSMALTPLISGIYILTIVLLPFKWALYYPYIVLIFIMEIFGETVIKVKSQFFSPTLIYNYYIIFIICILFMEKRISLLTMRKSVLSQKSV
ncbi:MAG: ComEC/Rec2 family competence protein [Mycoplasmatales bacterium]|nr:ComEC/Rec2 family competence protein [Mycoplasmatales bacterium]